MKKSLVAVPLVIAMLATAILATAILVPGIPVRAADPAKPNGRPSQDFQRRRDAAMEEIHKSARAFADAFNRGDPKAVAALWTEDGDYVNENGERFQGRDPIEQEYAAFFAAAPGAKIRLSVDSVRLLSDETAVEDGRATIEPLPHGPPAVSRYVVVHVKRDGQWLMSTVRDSRLEIPSNHDRLADLEFLVGTWVAEHNGSHVEATCRWMANKNYLQRLHTVRTGDQVVSTSTQMIGWDPLQQRVTSWTFTSDGGHAVGAWTPHESGWSIETVGVSFDGTQSRAVNILSHVDPNSVSWRSVSRRKGSMTLPDREAVVLKRQ